MRSIAWLGGEKVCLAYPFFSSSHTAVAVRMTSQGGYVVAVLRSSGAWGMGAELLVRQFVVVLACRGELSAPSKGGGLPCASGTGINWL